MNKFRFTINALAIAIFMCAFASLAQAQATRTWVSGVGDDANPCSRTAPCKTFAGAISKTAVDGEIDVLDPGGFGQLTIVKAITIDGGGFVASILSSSGAGININLTANSGSNKVQLRNLGIIGVSTATIGVRILSTNVSGVNVVIENCMIANFRGNGLGSRGISDERLNNGHLHVKDTMVKNNSGSGVVVIGASGTGTAVLDNVTSTLNGATGFVVSGATKTMILRNCNATKNAGIGIGAEVGAKMDVIDSLSAFNATGIDSANANTEIRVGRTRVTRNTSLGLAFNGGTILSYGNNEVSGNAGAGTSNGPFSGGGPSLQ